MNSIWRRLLLVAIVALLVGGCGASNEGAAIFAELRAEPIWTALPEGARTTLLSPPNAVVRTIQPMLS